jgi:oxygen-independent coproporphyrinogen-3 oxidase
MSALHRSAHFYAVQVSNYARRSSDGAKRSRHNQVYWHGKPYAAYGNGAASFVNSVRASRCTSQRTPSGVIKHGWEIPNYKWGF